MKQGVESRLDLDLIVTVTTNLSNYKDSVSGYSQVDLDNHSKSCNVVRRELNSKVKVDSVFTSCASGFTTLFLVDFFKIVLFTEVFIYI